MLTRCFPRSLRALAVILASLSAVSIVQGQGARQSATGTLVPDSDHVKERNEWFFRGRLLPGKPSADLRRRAYQAKLRLRVQRAAAVAAERGAARASGALGSLSGTWTPLGPVPL